MDPNVLLVKQKSSRKGKEQYTDLYLVWVYEGKVNNARIAHVFKNSFKPLMAKAITVPEGCSINSVVKL